MVLLSEVVERHQGELERLHGHQLLPSHRQALQAMRLSRVNQVDGLRQSG